jgi:hypothetical protein
MTMIKRILVLALMATVTHGATAIADSWQSRNNPGNLVYGPLTRSFGGTYSQPLPIPKGDLACGKVFPGHYDADCWKKFCAALGEDADGGSANIWKYDKKTGCDYLFNSKAFGEY